MWAELLGYRGEVYHFASYIVFFIGIILAIVLLRKKFGNIPTSFFIILTGMASTCLEYNVEVRMYALAFFGITFAFYSVYCILQNNKISGYVCFVICGLIGAYSHYYALLSISVLMVLTFIFACIVHKGKTWIKAAFSLVTFGLLYLPWLSTLLSAAKRVQGNWWMTDVPSLQICLDMILGGESMRVIVLPFLLVILLIAVIVESSFFSCFKKEDKLIVEVHSPNTKKWSIDLYMMLIGFSTIIFTLVIAYLACYLIRPVLSRRYVYPLGGIVAILLVVGASYFIKSSEKLAQLVKKTWLTKAAKGILLVILTVMFIIGVKNFQAASREFNDQKDKTQEILTLIGDSTQDITLVNNGISHIGWTVLPYYYPEAEIINSSFTEIEADDFWYFTSEFLDQEQFDSLAEAGYAIQYGYGEKQLVKYPLVLYRFQKY